MKFSREKLASVLNTVAPALGEDGVIEGLTMLWFSGSLVTAYNGIIGISAPLDTDFTGGASGRLHGFVDKASTDELTLDATSIELVVKSGRSRLELPLAPIDSALWSFPDYDKTTFIPITTDFMKAIKFVLVSVAKKTAVPDQLGITMVVNGSLHLFSTDAKTMSWASTEIASEMDPELRVVVPTQFLESVAKLSAAGDLLYPSDKSVVTVNKAGVKIFTHLMAVDMPLDFTGTILTAVPEDPFWKFDKEMEYILDRVELMRQDKDHDNVAIVVNSDSLEFSIKTPLGELHDSLQVSCGVEEPFTVSIDPSLIKRALEDKDGFIITERCMVLSGPMNFLHLIATKG